MKTNNRYKIIWITLLLFLISVFIWLTGGIPAYFYALYLEGNWAQADPKTKNEIEQYLYLYSLHQIKPKDSMWGYDYNLQPGERMMQYRILWRKDCPLDVVYDQNDNIKAIYTSYE